MGKCYRHAAHCGHFALIVGTCLVTSLLTAIPARIGSRHPTARILQAELS
jgi:hypothetical protein